MSDLNARARSLLQSIQFADDPTEAEFDRVEKALEARIRLGVAAAVATAAATSTGSSTAASTATATAASNAAALSGVATASNAAALGGVASSGGLGGALVFKAIVASVLAATLATGTGAAILSRRAARSGPSVPAAVRPAAETPIAPMRRLPASAAAEPFNPPAPSTGARKAVDDWTESTPVSMASVGSMARSLGPVLPQSTRPAAGRTNAPGPAPSSAGRAQPLDEADPIAPAVDPLDEEVAWLRAARSSLHEGRPLEALQELDQSAIRFSGGVLAEDRNAERIFVLCALGRVDEARMHAERFLAQHPRSSYAPSVRSSCGFESPTPPK